MIPVRLRLRNFMCYRDNVPSIHFEGIHTACICGDNGNGKSALIDAITWALWGKARATRSDDDLVHSTQTEMEVEFDFAVAQQTYRIIRKHAKPRNRRVSGRTELQLQMVNGDTVRAIPGDTLSQTQKKIIDIIHMDYETFINSAYLRQGRADEFTTKRPVERKEVLASILGLSFYDALEERARDLARQREAEAAQIESTIGDINQELERIPACQTELDSAVGELSRLEKELAEHEARLNGLRQQRDYLESKRTQLTRLEEHIGATQRELARWNEQAGQHRSRIKEYEGLLSRRQEIEDGYARLAKARNLCQALDQKLRQVASLNEHRHRLELSITQAGQTLVAEHHLLQNRIKELEAVASQLPKLKNQLQQVEGEKARLSEQEEGLSGKRRGGQELRAGIQYLESSQIQLRQEIEGIDEKLKLLRSKEEARCPLCESELGTEGMQRIEARYSADRAARKQALEENRAAISPKKIELGELDKEILNMENRLGQERASVQGKISILGREINEAEKATERLGQTRKDLAIVEERLARREFALVEQDILRKLDEELARLDYDPRQHEEARSQLASLEQYEAPGRKLEEADRLIDQERQGLARAEEAVREHCLSLEDANRERQELIRTLEGLPGLLTDLERAEGEYLALTTRQREARERLGTIRARLEYLAGLEIKRKDRANKLEQAVKEEALYRELARVFGKGGIQAHLIEAALPEIEIETNRLLGRMTDNRMHVKIETQRETRKGDTIETLDINISDELGTRSYEMFSGGEAFRINFAIRIALSRLLARRAGAPLPTLIIDEGFGTQDNAGIEKVREAINSIQDSFEKILVITHIDEMKDAFPARIDVIKTADGSTIETS